jgi:uncharacterized membrane protein
VTLESNKNLGGIGAILMFIGFLPVVNFYGILSFVGLILVMVALYNLAHFYMESGIFNNALYGVITAIVGVIIVAVVAVFALVGFFSELGLNIGLGNMADWSAILTQIDWTNIGLDFMGSFDFIGNFLVYILLDLVILMVFVILTAVFLRKSLKLLSAKTGVGMFGTTGLIILIGAVLTIIGIGLLLIWIALLLLAVAFFQIRPQQTQPPPPPY